MLHPKLVRNDYFDRHDYTLHVAKNVSVRMSTDEARHLYAQLREELEPKERKMADLDWLDQILTPRSEAKDFNDG